jgi:LacI family transcriptional regulator
MKFVQSIASFFYFYYLINRPVSKKHSTIHDIARELSITASTVSRALSGHPRISVTTKQLVQDMVSKLNYKPNTIASNLRKGKGNTIGVIIPVINRYLFANIIHGIESIANEAGYSVIICQSNENLIKENECIKTLVSNRVSGIMISVSAETKNADHFEPAVKSGIPIVQFDRIIDTFNSSKISSDDFAGAYKEVSHLSEQGFRKIAHFAGPLHLKMYENRFEGYKKALADNLINLNTNLIYEGYISREKAIEGMKLVLKLPYKVDALFAASDLSALGALSVLKEEKIKVPQQFGIAGYANELFSEYTDPSLTSTEQFGEDIGKISARVMLEEINNTQILSPQIITIAPKLIKRHSSCLILF